MRFLRTLSLVVAVAGACEATGRTGRTGEFPATAPKPPPEAPGRATPPARAPVPAASSPADDSAPLEMVVQRGHNDAIGGLSFSPDGRHLASSSDEIKLWTLDGRLVRTMVGHSKFTDDVQFSPDGKLLATAGRDGTIKLWDAATGKVLATLSGHLKRVTSVDFHPDGSRLASSSDDKTLRLWSLGGECLAAIPGHTDTISRVRFSPDGTLLASCSADGTVRLWSLDGSPRLTFRGHEAQPYDVVFHPSGREIASSDLGGAIKIWSLEGKTLRSLARPDSPVYVLAWGPRGESLYAGGTGEKLLRWDSVYRLAEAPVRPYATYAIAIDPVGGHVACGGDYPGGIIHIFDGGGRPIRDLGRGADAVTSLASSPDGRLVAAGCGDNSVRLWNPDGRLVGRLRGEPIEGRKNIPVSVAFSPDGGNLVANLESKAVTVWRPDGARVKTFEECQLAIWDVAFSPDGEHIVSSGQLETFRLWRRSGELVRQFDGHEGETLCAVFSPDGLEIACDGPGGLVEVWRLDGTLARSWPADPGGVWTLAFTPDGKHLLTSAIQDRAIKVWTREGALVRAIPVRDFPHLIAVSRDGERFATSGLPGGLSDGTIDVWSLDGRMLRKLEGHPLGVRSLLFRADGACLLSGGDEGSIRVWDLETGSYVALLSQGDDWIAYTPDGYFDASPGGGGLVAMARGMQVFGVDQFAVRNNRPDIVLRRLRREDASAERSLRSQYLKRLSQLGMAPRTIDARTFEESIVARIPESRERSFLRGLYAAVGSHYELRTGLTPEQAFRAFSSPAYLEHLERRWGQRLHVPVATIVDLAQDGKFVDLTIRLQDTEYDLYRYNVYVNNVPLHGGLGREIAGRAQTIRERIELTPGPNRIEASCHNDRLAESYRDLRQVDYSGKVESDLYFVGFGVSKHRDSRLDLEYAAKDASDLAGLFSGMRGRFRQVHAKTFLDDRVTGDSVHEASELLRKATVDDTLVLFVAGHGVHDRDAVGTYYFATHDVDLEDLPGTGVPFESFEDLLQNAPPRTKLFLMDTCESGESDPEARRRLLARADAAGMVPRAARDLGVRAKSTRTVLLEKDRFIYNDLRKRSGAIVLSSSRGDELSYESKEIENGYFTEAILRAFQAGTADRDGDGVVSTDELRGFVCEQVPRSTRGAQHPTVDRDNIHQRFGFPVVR